MKKETAMIAVAVVCVGVIAVAGVFLPSQTPQQIAGNEAWQFKQEFNGYGTDAKNIQVDIESDVWRVVWYAFAMENFEEYSGFDIAIISYPENGLMAVGTMEGGTPAWGVNYIIQGGRFDIQVTTANVNFWAIRIYELD